MVAISESEIWVAIGKLVNLKELVINTRLRITLDDDAAINLGLNMRNLVKL